MNKLFVIALLQILTIPFISGCSGTEEVPAVTESELSEQSKSLIREFVETSRNAITQIKTTDVDAFTESLEGSREVVGDKIQGAVDAANKFKVAVEKKSPKAELLKILDELEQEAETL